MVVTVTKDLELPRRGYIVSEASEPNEYGRRLVEIRATSGRSIISRAVITVPADAVEPQQEFFLLRAGIYEVKEATDKRGVQLLKFYHSHHSETTFVLVSVNGWLVKEASHPSAVQLTGLEGYSRTRRHGERFAMIVVPLGATIAVEGYEEARDGDPRYYRVTTSGLVEIATTVVTLHPTEW